MPRIALLVALLAQCALWLSPGASNADSTESTATAASTELERIVETYFDRTMELNPVFATFNGDHRFNDQFPNTLGPDHRALAEALEHEYFEAIEAIDPTGLDTQDRLSWEIFRRDRVEAIEGLRFPDHLLPVNQMFSVPVFAVQLGSPGGAQPFDTVADYENWLGRIDGFAVWMDQAVTNMREGIERGVVLPRIIVDKSLPILAGQIVDEPSESGFYRVIEAMPESFSPEDRERLELAYRRAIQEKIVPAYAKLHDFMRDEYLEHARDSISLSELPGGEDWYEYMIGVHTNTKLSAREIHEKGLAEVERIQGEMRKLAEEVGFEGDLGQMRGWMREQESLRYSSADDVLESYRSLREIVHPKLETLFSELPRADYEIRPVEEYRQATTPGAHYMPPSPDGARPGVFYVNTGGWERRNRAGSDALFLHEAMPGHHFQVALARELGELPRFRRFGGFTAYIEGWGLYAERLGTQLGLYRDPFQQLGQLQSEMFRARRLVVDTGIHALGWTRDEALAYLPSQVEVDRYIVMPGQALAYKIGELKILELRARAEERLGERFDLKDFHDAVLVDGSLPLDVLDANVERWIKASE